MIDLALDEKWAGLGFRSYAPRPPSSSNASDGLAENKSLPRSQARSYPGNPSANREKNSRRETPGRLGFRSVIISSLRGGRRCFAGTLGGRPAYTIANATCSINIQELR